ncbi:MAG: regulatory protein RecX [Coriobacteriia bacterium]|nr:regulatory protein RecX [Coriobacteriia bacterium]
MGAVTVQRIEVTGPAGRVRRLVFDDGSSRTTSAAVIKVLALEEGSLVDEEQLAQSEDSCARDRVLRMLSSRERSRADVASRLQTDGYSVALSETICGRFVELGLIDDDRFARMLVRTQARSGFGGRRIAADLRRHGVAETIATAALAEEYGSETELLRTLLANRPRRDSDSREKVLRRFVNRGFSVTQVLEVLREEPRHE